MECRNCGSTKVNVQVVTETKLKNKHHSIFYWLIIGWWLHPILWIFLTLPMILLKLFGGKDKKLVQKNHSIAVCQECGHKWNV